MPNMAVWRLILGRFFPIVRTFAPIFAGVVKVDIKKFTLYNIIGSVAWVTTLTLSRVFFRQKISRAKRLPAIHCT
jgi:membrane-associated protein